jgi:hypothetical protein
METVLSICLGIGLSAACGFRVFVPLLVMSIASLSGHLTLAPGFAWLGSYPALLTLAVATCAEVAGYYIPWIDHLLDTIATPAAIIAGTIITAAVFTGSSPLLKWSLAAIAGGGAAAAVQTATVVGRTGSTAATGGLTNPIFSTLELIGATVTSLASLIAPMLVAVLFILCFVFFGRRLLRRFRTARVAAPQKIEASAAP